MEWKYDGNKPELVTITENGSSTSYCFAYNSDGNLKEIYFGDEPSDGVSYTMKYDDEGRVTQIINYSFHGGDTIYDYSYNADGHLEEYVESSGYPSKLQGVKKYEQVTEKSYIELNYTDDGRLLRFCEPEYDKIYEYEYDDEGRLIEKVVQISDKVQTFKFTYNGEIPEETTGNCLYDENGCLVKVIDEDGSYIQYKYMELTLTKEEALWHRRQQQLYFRNYDLGEQNLWDIRYYLVPFPLDPRLLVTPVTEYGN